MRFTDQLALIVYVLGVAFTSVGAKENGAGFFAAVWLGVFFPIAVFVGLTYAAVQDLRKARR